MALDIPAGETQTVAAGSTSYGDPVNLDGTLNVAGVLNISTTAPQTAAGVAEPVGTGAVTRFRSTGLASGVGAGVGRAEDTVRQFEQATGSAEALGRGRGIEAILPVARGTIDTAGTAAFPILILRRVGVGEAIPDGTGDLTRRRFEVGRGAADALGRGKDTRLNFQAGRGMAVAVGAGDQSQGVPVYRRFEYTISRDEK